MLLAKASNEIYRKQEAWARNVQVLMKEFECFSKAGFNFNSGTVGALCKGIIRDPDKEYRVDLVGRVATDSIGGIAMRWIQGFIDGFKIISRRQGENLLVSPVQ